MQRASPGVRAAESGPPIKSGGDVSGASAWCPSPYEVITSRNRLAGLLPVGEEGFEALVGERVFGQRLQDRRRNRRHIGASHRHLLDMKRRADRGGENLGLQRVEIVVDGADLADQVDAVDA